MIRHTGWRDSQKLMDEECDWRFVVSRKYSGGVELSNKIFTYILSQNLLENLDTVENCQQRTIQCIIMFVKSKFEYITLEFEINCDLLGIYFGFILLYPCIKHIHFKNGSVRDIISKSLTPQMQYLITLALSNIDTDEGAMLNLSQYLEVTENLTPQDCKFIEHVNEGFEQYICSSLNLFVTSKTESIFSCLSQE